MMVRMLLLFSILLPNAVSCVIRAIQGLLMKSILLLIPHGGAVELRSLLALVLWTSPWLTDLKVSCCLISMCCFTPIAALNLHHPREDMHTKRKSKSE